MNYQQRIAARRRAIAPVCDLTLGRVQMARRWLTTIRSIVDADALEELDEEDFNNLVGLASDPELMALPDALFDALMHEAHRRAEAFSSRSDAL